MSASIVAADPRLQNWFMNSSHDTDPSPYTHHSYRESITTNPTATLTTAHSMPSSHSKPLFGTSIFGAPPSNTYTAATAHSPLVPPQCAPSNCNPQSRSPTPEPPPSTPPILMDEMSSINHLITTLSYAIQEMNQYLDTNSTTCTAAIPPIHTKTTNCRNEMVSTLSYYQTYIQSKSAQLGSRSLSPLQMDMEPDTKPPLLPPNTPDEKDPYYPLHQGLEFERTTYGASSHAKAIALDVVGHIIGTPGPLIADDSIPPPDTSPPPLASYTISQTTPPVANSQQMDEKEQEHKLKSTLNAYAQPYESQSPYTHPHPNPIPMQNPAVPLPLAPHTVPTASNIHSPRYIQQSLTSPSIPSISSPTQTYLMHQFNQQNNGTSTIQQYYNTLAVQQRATKHTSSQEMTGYPSLVSQNRMARNHTLDMKRKREGMEDGKEMERYNEEEEDDDEEEEEDDEEEEEEEEEEENDEDGRHGEEEEEDYIMMEQETHDRLIDNMHEDGEMRMIRTAHHKKSLNPSPSTTATATTAAKPKSMAMKHTKAGNKSNTKPLWSAIAKQVAKAPPPLAIHSTKANVNNEDEKSPEDKRYHVNNSNNNTSYWNNHHNKRHSNHYSSERSSASSHSSASSSNHHNNNNNIGTATTATTNTNTPTTQSSRRTPSPSPPEHTTHHNNNNNNNNHRNMNNYHRRNHHHHNGNNQTKHVQNGKSERCRVFVSNLPPNVTDQDIRNAFAHCGEISNTVWFPSRTDGKFYGSGLITFCDGMGSKEALRMNQQNVLGRIIRCEYSSCQDPVKVKPPGCRTIYLNNVPRDAHESRIRQVFKHCGKIKRVRFHERDTKRTGGAFVEFENTSSCDKALDLHGKIVDNHPLYVDYQRY